MREQIAKHIFIGLRGDYMDFEILKKQGKTVIYKESETELNDTDWELWGKRKTIDVEVFVYRKIVTFDEAEQYELENELPN